MNKIETKTRYSEEELQEFKTLIEERLIEAKEQLDFYRNQLSELGESSDAKVKGLDDGISTVESERLITLASRQKKLIRHLENAIIRIENNAYGVCRETGKLISKERLRAVPHATLSIEAKQGRRR